MQVGGSGGPDFQLVSAGSVGTSVVGGGDGAASASASTLPAVSIVGGAVPGAASGAGTLANAARIVPMAQPAPVATVAPTAANMAALAQVANTGAADGAALQAHIQGLLAGTIVPTAEEQPYVDTIRRAQQGGAAPTMTTVAAPAATAPAGAAETSAFEQRVLELVNVERARAGLGPVRYHGTLDQAATGHNAQQAATQTMAHEGIGDGTPGDRARAVGWTDSWGENVAVGQTSPEQVVAEWMASPGHRRNILDPSFANMGVSHTTDASGRQYWAQTFGA